MAFYEDFSRVYDQVMDQELYEQWLDFTKRHLPKETKSVFELACGSGALSVRLAQEGYKVTGLDISEEMLTLASKKARQAGYQLDFTAGDMRELSGLGKFDAVTCYSDSLCYLENLDESFLDETKKRDLTVDLLLLLLQDINAWIVAVFVEQIVRDIHYFDASFANSCLPKPIENT